MHATDGPVSHSGQLEGRGAEVAGRGAQPVKLVVPCPVTHGWTAQVQKVRTWVAWLFTLLKVLCPVMDGWKVGVQEGRDQGTRPSGQLRIICPIVNGCYCFLTVEKFS